MEDFGGLIEDTYAEDILLQHRGAIGLARLISRLNIAGKLVDTGLVPRLIYFVRQSYQP
jgi:hypothetical protein